MARSVVARCHLRSQWSGRQVSQLSPVVPCLHRQMLRLWGSSGSLGIYIKWKIFVNL